MTPGLKDRQKEEGVGVECGALTTSDKQFTPRASRVPTVCISKAKANTHSITMQAARLSMLENDQVICQPKDI